MPLGPNPPQFNALKPDTDLVTVTIGANDISIGDLWSSCARLGPTDPLGSPCQRQATAGGVDLYAQRVAAAAPKVAQVLDGIRQRSPRATVVLVDYLRVVPSTTGCYPDLSIARGDVSYMDTVQQQLTAMLAEQARKHSAAFVDSYTNAADHDACQPPGVKWAKGTAPTSSATAMHPNATGMAAVTGLLLDKLASIGRGPDAAG